MSVPILFEMETGDPDDLWTLSWLCKSKHVDLRGVVVTPGGPDQLQLVSFALRAHHRADVPLGGFHGPRWDDGKRRVSRWYTHHYPAWERATTLPVEHGPALLVRHSGPDVTVLCGAPPKNLAEAVEDRGVAFGRWVQQGGFAGPPVVEPIDVLPKFRGMKVCASFNVGGAARRVLKLIEAPFTDRIWVSKNVCHGVTWSSLIRTELEDHLPRFTTESLRAYNHHGKPKALHDLVAAAVAVADDVCTLRPVDIFREKGAWGAQLNPEGPVRISTAFNQRRFIETLKE